ncbi:MAG: DNA translocase FtsK [Litoreibacter sp.]
MAFQTRPRDPLLDSDMQAALEKRGKELLGFALVAFSLMMALILSSYVPDDPSWLSATDEPAQNYFGRFGAWLAGLLFVIIGFGAWVIPVVAAVWGLRFVLHMGEDRIFSLIFAPLAVVAASVYASTHLPMPEWTHSFGLGGLFGDTVLGALLNILPVSATSGLKVLAFIAFLILAALSLFVLGFDKEELRSFLRFMFIGAILTYVNVMKMCGFAGRMTGQAAASAVRKANEVREARRDAQTTSEDIPYYDEPQLKAEPVRRTPIISASRPVDPDPVIETEEPAPKTGLLASLVKRVVEPEVEEDEVVTYPVDPESSEDRIRSKISNVIKNRARQVPTFEVKPASLKPEPRLTRSMEPVPARIEPVLSHEIEQPQIVEDTQYVEEVQHEDEVPYVEVTPVETVAQAIIPEPIQPEPPVEQIVVPEPVVPDIDVQPETIQEAVIEAAAPISAPRIPSAPITRPVVQHPTRKAVAPSAKAKAEAQPALQFEEKGDDFELPPLNLLTNPSTVERHVLSDESLEENARMLEAVLDDYGVKGEIVAVRPGPVVTMYELEPAPGLKASRVIGLSDDIARSMSALSARVSTVPGRSVIGIELPNEKREMVVLREILAARDFGDGNQKLPLALGKDIGGDAIVANLAKMPHLLIAGTTGSGKSVAINTMILSLLYKLSPDECRLIMIDPKMLELSVYDGIPHLLSPVVTDPKKAVVALKWTVGEMEERYRKMSKMGVRNIDGYNSRVKDALAKDEMFSRTVQTGFDDETGEPIFETEEFQPEAMPYIVVIVDEMADLMMVAGKEIEACIQRLAQMARASGIHLIMATQRPSVDVITGTIKANFPTRISFQVTSKIDSRTILGEMGAEQLLGMGDMLYMAGGSKITRVHGPFVSDEEVEEVVNHLKSFGPPSYMSGVIEGPDEEKSSDIDMVLGLGGNTDGEDALYDTAVAIVIKDRKCSTSYIQRKLAIGYNKAARLVEQMEEEGLVSPANHVGKREILIPEQN